jgi:polysaccharide transporter, PST family
MIKTKILPQLLYEDVDKQYTLKQVISNTGWLFADKVIRVGIGLFVVVWMARYLGPSNYGLLNYAIAFTSLFSALASLGLDGIVIRDILKEVSHKDEILGTAFSLKLAGGVITIVLTFVGIFILRPADSVIHWLVLITAFGVIFQAFDTIDLWFQSQVQSKYSVYAKNAAFLVVSICKIVLILTKASLIAFALAGLVEIILGSLGLIMAYRIHGQSLKNWHSNFARTILLLKDSWPLMLSGVIVMIYLRIDQVMLGNILGSKEVGIYSVAVNLVEFWYFIPMAITATVFPIIVNAKKRSDALYYEKLEKLYLLMVWLALSVAIFITIFSQGIVLFIYGEQYKSAYTALSILCWSGLFISSGLVSNHWYLLENLNHYTLYRHLVGVIVNIVLNYILIPSYGINGAALATLITQFIASYMFDYFNKPTKILFRMKSKFFFLFVPITVGYAKRYWHQAYYTKSRRSL